MSCDKCSDLARQLAARDAALGAAHERLEKLKDQIVTLAGERDRADAERNEAQAEIAQVEERLLSMGYDSHPLASIDRLAAMVAAERKAAHDLLDRLKAAEERAERLEKALLLAFPVDNPKWTWSSESPEAMARCIREERDEARAEAAGLRDGIGRVIASLEGSARSGGGYPEASAHNGALDIGAGQLHDLLDETPTPHADRWLERVQALELLYEAVKLHNDALARFPCECVVEEGSEVWVAEQTVLTCVARIVALSRGTSHE